MCGALAACAVCAYRLRLPSIRRRRALEAMRGSDGELPTVSVDGGAASREPSATDGSGGGSQLARRLSDGLAHAGIGAAANAHGGDDVGTSAVRCSPVEPAAASQAAHRPDPAGAPPPGEAHATSEIELADLHGGRQRGLAQAGCRPP